MGRKSKRMALYEAIRQGQAKIAQGLESGQMRSDGQGRQNAPQQTDQQPAARQRLVGKSALFESKESPRGLLATPQRVKMVLAAGAVLIVVLLIMLGRLVFPGSDSTEPTSGQPPIAQGDGNDSSGQPDSSGGAATVPDSEATTSSGRGGSSFLGFPRKDKDPGKPKDKEPEKEPVKPREPVYASTIGKNVIWIQSISPDRKDLLLPLKEFFASKGIPTEVIITPAKDYAALVTRQGFDKNPANSGTEGYKLFQKIKQLGLIYQEETSDTTWGVRPFQDIYGYKRTQ